MPAQPACKERLDRHFIGGAEPRRGGAADAPGLVREWQAAKSGSVGSLEVEAPQLGPLDTTERGGDSGRVRKCVADGQSHVGHRELGDGAAVGELDHRVHHALRVHDDLDDVIWGTEQLVRLDDFQTLVHQGAGVDGDLRTHLPGRVRQSLVDANVGQIRKSAATERATTRRQDDATDLAVVECGRPQALVHRTVLAVHRHQFGARRGAQWLHHRGTGDEAFLVGERQPFAGSQRANRDLEAGEADDTVDDHISNVDQVGEVGYDLCKRQCGGDLRPLGGISNCNHLRTELERLFDEQRDR